MVRTDGLPASELEELPKGYGSVYIVAKGPVLTRINVFKVVNLGLGYKDYIWRRSKQAIDIRKEKGDESKLKQEVHEEAHTNHISPPPTASPTPFASTQCPTLT